jgi:hypothetical protein
VPVALRARLRSRELGCVEVANALLRALAEDDLRVWAALAPELLGCTGDDTRTLSVAAWLERVVGFVGPPPGS